MSFRTREIIKHEGRKRERKDKKTVPQISNANNIGGRCRSLSLSLSLSRPLELKLYFRMENFFYFYSSGL